MEDYINEVINQTLTELKFQVSSDKKTELYQSINEQIKDVIKNKIKVEIKKQCRRTGQVGRPTGTKQVRNIERDSKIMKLYRDSHTYKRISEITEIPKTTVTRCIQYYTENPTELELLNV